MIGDREESLAALQKLGEEMEGSRVRGDLEGLRQRFNRLSEGSRRSMSGLEAALAAAKLMQDDSEYWMQQEVPVDMSPCYPVPVSRCCIVCSNVGDGNTYIAVKVDSITRQPFSV